MNLRIGILVLALATVAYGQSPAAKTVKKPVNAAPAATAVKPGSSAKQQTAQANPPAAAQKSAVAKKETPKKQAPKKEAAKEQPAAAVNTATAVSTAAPAAGTKRAQARRDPFVSPVSDRNNEPVDCGSGKRCLVPDQTMLRGVVKAPNGMIAVVTNPQEKAYFLRENDPVYNGYVLRITPNSVVFRETVEDRLGRKSTREVVKKVNAPAV